MLKTKKGDMVRPGVRVQKGTVLLSPAGWIRVSEDLVPEQFRGKKFSVQFECKREGPIRKGIVVPGKLFFRVSENDAQKNSCWYSNKSSRHPLVSVRGVFRAFGISLPERPRIFSARKQKGWVVLTF